MKKQISPVAAGVLIGIVVLIAIVLIWKGGQRQVSLPDKPPSGPIVLPPSQQGRIMPNKPFSGTEMPASKGDRH